MPATVGLDLKVILTDADAGEEGARQGEQTDLPRLIPLESGALHTAGVLDGRYRVNVQGHSSRWESSAEHIGRRIQIDTDDWPAEIEIRGNTVELPPVRLRMAADIVNLSPADGTAVNLSDLDLRWEPVPNADQYGVQFGSIVNTPHVTVSLFVFARNSRPQLTVNDLSELERRQLRENLPVGRTALWKVVAWDAAGRQIGVMLNENRFLVAGALP